MTTILFNPRTYHKPIQSTPRPSISAAPTQRHTELTWGEVFKRFPANHVNVVEVDWKEYFQTAARLTRARTQPRQTQAKIKAAVQTKTERNLESYEDEYVSER